MTFDFLDKKSIHKWIASYKKLLLDTPKGMKGEAELPAANFLFNINNNSKKIEEGCAQPSHTITAKLMFLFKHAQPDTHTAVVFFIPRVTSLEVDN